MFDSSDKDSDVEDIIEMRQMQPKRSTFGLESLVLSGRVAAGPDVTQSAWSTPQHNMIGDQNRGARHQSYSDTDFPAVIPLNVGGIKYMTRLSTLTKYPDSMLAAMFSGRHSVDKDEYGNYFLDSNGTMFGYILDYLRTMALPPNGSVLAVYRDANYYGLHDLIDKLNLKPEIAKLQVQEAHRMQFPDYYNVKNKIVQLAIDNAAQNRTGEVVLNVSKNDFIPKAPNFNPKHGCVIDAAHITIGPWKAVADEEMFMRCLENDLTEEGFCLRPHEQKRKCRYFHGQTCQKFVYKLQIMF